MWRITFPLGSNQGASELFYPNSGTYLTSRYTSRVSDTTTLHLEVGLNSTIKQATGSDSDWDYSQTSNLWYYGTFTAGGKSGYFHIDWEKPLNRTCTVNYGYSYNRNSFTMTHGTYYIENYIVDNPPALLSNLASSYTISYQGPHIGISTKRKLSPSVSLDGTITVTPVALVQGHGWWNLRSLTFVHTGAGQMWDASLGINYAPQSSSRFNLVAGYRWQYSFLYQGVEDTSSSITWDKAVSNQHGFYLTSRFKF
ncbi:MAG: hypothetical protein H6Q75_1053 [Firmicutes bacterium]|nr:hypothetical protein [Bacillota bacterium]